MFSKRTTDTLHIVSVNDEALDKSNSAGAKAVREYQRSREEHTSLQLKPGLRPTVFHCKPLSRREKLFLDSLVHDEQRWQWAFAIALREITDGPPVRLVYTDGGWDRDGRALDEDTLDQLAQYVGCAVIQEIGHVVYQQATLSVLQKKAYRLPPGYVVVWDEPPIAAPPPDMSATSARSDS